MLPQKTHLARNGAAAFPNALTLAKSQAERRQERLEHVRPSAAYRTGELAALSQIIRVESQLLPCAF